MTTLSRGVLGLSGGALLAVLVAGGPGAQTLPDAERGRALFAAKQCVRCHVAGGSGGAPALEQLRQPQGTFELAGRLWNHVPSMWKTLADAGVAWPDISWAEMADLMAYLNADGGRDARPDSARGRVVLMRKGCLKCHSLNREGGDLPPDLGTARADYASAPAWASTMWTHTPRMVEMSRRRQVDYPRFTGDEMSNLLGFLRSASKR